MMMIFNKPFFVLVSIMVFSPFTAACTPNGGTCTCGSSGDGKIITLTQFTAEFIDQKVNGCGGAFELKSISVGGDVTGTITSSGVELSKGVNVGVNFEKQDSYLGWEGCCAVCGQNLEAVGELAPGWYCEKDLPDIVATGIWLKGTPTTHSVSTGVPDWETCTSGDLCSSTSYTCCVAPADIESMNYTCRPSSDCSTGSSTDNTGIADWETCSSGDVCSSSSYTCCIAPADVESAKYTCRPSSDCSGNTNQDSDFAADKTSNFAADKTDPPTPVAAPSADKAVAPQSVEKTDSPVLPTSTKKTEAPVAAPLSVKSFDNSTSSSSANAKMLTIMLTVLVGFYNIYTV